MRVGAGIRIGRHEHYGARIAGETLALDQWFRQAQPAFAEKGHQTLVVSGLVDRIRPVAQRTIDLEGEIPYPIGSIGVEVDAGAPRLGPAVGIALEGEVPEREELPPGRLSSSPTRSVWRLSVALLALQAAPTSSTMRPRCRTSGPWRLFPRGKANWPASLWKLHRVRLTANKAAARRRPGGEHRARGNPRDDLGDKGMPCRSDKERTVLRQESPKHSEEAEDDDERVRQLYGPKEIVETRY